MFSKISNKSKDEAGGLASTRSIPSILSVDMIITGSLKSEGEIQIDGTIEGDIFAKVLLVGQGAKIKGAIIAEAVQVHGIIHGQIKAKSVILGKTAHVVGDILHEDLSIEKGAFLEGNCKSVTYVTSQKEPLNVVSKRPSDARVIAVTNDIKGGTAKGSSGQPAQEQSKKIIRA